MDREQENSHLGCSFLPPYRLDLIVSVFIAQNIIINKRAGGNFPDDKQVDDTDCGDGITNAYLFQIHPVTYVNYVQLFICQKKFLSKKAPQQHSQ